MDANYSIFSEELCGMTIEMAIDIFQGMIRFCLMMVSPILLMAIAVGVSVSIAQTITSIQEQTLTFVPKLFSVAALLVASASWFLTSLIDYTRGLFDLMTTLGQ